MRIETKRLYIRQMTENDFDLMSLIWMEQYPPLFDGSKEVQEKLLRNLWETTQDPTVLTCLIFFRDSNQFCGRVNMQKIDKEVLELGIDLLKEYQNQGYGPEVIVAFANWYGENRHISEIKVCITAANARSTHVFQKLGAKYMQEDPSFFALAKSLAEELPEKREAILQDLSVREYIGRCAAWSSRWQALGDGLRRRRSLPNCGRDTPATRLYWMSWGGYSGNVEIERGGAAVPLCIWSALGIEESYEAN